MPLLINTADAFFKLDTYIIDIRVILNTFRDTLSQSNMLCGTYCFLQVNVVKLNIFFGL